MLEKPLLPDSTLIASLRQYYGLTVAQIAFLPLGADPNTAVYRVDAGKGKAYFLKLRLGNFDQASVIVPRFLLDQGIRQVIAPLETLDRRLWVPVNGYVQILYPFVEGSDAVDRPLSPDQWIEFGQALRAIHSAALPAELRELLGHETYSTSWRESVKNFLCRVDQETFPEPTASKTAAFLLARRAEINHLVDRAEHLAARLRQRSPEFVLCHADIFAANLLIDGQGNFYMIDWDNPILAPRERDLMYIGGGICGVWNTPAENAQFYLGYGPVEIDPVALTYYRYERIVEDIAVFCEGLLSTGAGGPDRERDLEFLQSNFEPGEVLEIARKTDRDLLG